VETLLILGKILLVSFAVGNIAYVVFSEGKNYKFAFAIWRNFSIRMFFEVMSVIAIVTLIVITLWQVPYLGKGWSSLFFHGESNNVLLQPVKEGMQSPYLPIRVLVPFFLVIFALVIPFFAKYEEDIFRRGYYKWSHITRQSIIFGLGHCVVGVPLAAGIALIFSGLFYGLKYRRSFEKNLRHVSFEQAEEEAVIVSTTYHAMYNTILLSIFLVLSIVSI
jgi:hypothetical protein